MILRMIAGLFLILGGAALVVLIQVGSGIEFAPSPALDPATFVSIILTALGVILAALALFIGVLAVIGWATFENKIKSNAEAFLDKRFSPEDERYIELIKEIKEDVRRQIEITRKKDIPENESPFSEDAV